MQKSIFITGASSGLGRATALQFAQNGWRVWATMRAGSQLKSGLDQVEGITLLPLDVTDPDQIEAAVNHATSTGRVDVVFANAGYALGGPLEAINDGQLTKQIQTNLLGSIRTIKSFLPHFRQTGSGVFLTTGSAAGCVGMPLLSVYCATKFALMGWAEALSYELPAGVRIKVIVPGSMQTNFLYASDHVQHEQYRVLSGKADAFYAEAALAATDATPEKVARAVWDATHDQSDQLAYLVTQEARHTITAREDLGADGFRAHIRQALSIAH